MILPIALLSSARAPVVPSSLILVPKPAHCVVLPGSFALTDRIAIEYDPKESEDRFAAGQVSDEVWQDLGIQLANFTPSVGKRIILVRSLTTSTSVAAQQGYQLDVSADQIKVSAHTGVGIFNGVQTLKQLIRANRTGNDIPQCHIEDWPVLTYRGWQHDISRGPIPTLSFLKQEVRTLSEFKLNLMTLYTEHVFKLKKHPDIAPADGITAAEVRELSKYANRYHVELAGNFQSFGHFANILKVPGYENIAENRNVISPAKEESYRFLADVYSEIAPAYTSPLFDINCDEVSGLGQGPSRDLVQKIGVAGVYAQHINRICDLLKQYGKTPMMWGDIALHYPAIVPKLPKDLIVLPWSYGASPSFENQILPFTKYGLRFMVCPGVSCWSQIWPDLNNATINISNFIRDGAANGAMGALNTSWDDDGMNLFNDNWYEFVWGAECSWRPLPLDRNGDLNLEREARVREFDSEFPSVFYGLAGSDLSVALNKLSEFRKNPVGAGLNNRVLWRDPVATWRGLSDKGRVAEVLNDLNPVEATLSFARRHATHNGPTLDYALFAARQERFLGDSLQIADPKFFKAAGLNRLIRTVKDLKKEYTSLWFRENHKWWLDHNLPHYDDLLRKLTMMSNPVVTELAGFASERDRQHDETVAKEDTIHGAPQGALRN